MALSRRQNPESWPVSRHFCEVVMLSGEVEELIQNSAYHMRVFWVFNGFSSEDGEYDKNEEEYGEG